MLDVIFAATDVVSLTSMLIAILIAMRMASWVSYLEHKLGELRKERRRPTLYRVK